MTTFLLEILNVFRYGITPTGEPLDVAMLKQIQMHQNLQVEKHKVNEVPLRFE